MEVDIPDVVVPPEFDFRNLDRLAKEFENTNGSYFRKLTHFLEEEGQALRTQISSFYVPNWQEYFDASRDQVRCALESIWYDKLDISEYKKKFFQVDEMKRDAETKLNALKREMDELSLWRKAVLNYDNGLYPRFKEVQFSTLVPMWLGLRELSDLYRKLNTHYNRTTTINLKKLDMQINEYLEYDGDEDARFYMKSIIFRRQEVAITDNRKERHELELLQKKVSDMYSFSRKWEKWCVMQALKHMMCRHLIFFMPRKLSGIIALVVLLVCIIYAPEVMFPLCSIFTWVSLISKAIVRICRMFRKICSKFYL